MKMGKMAGKMGGNSMTPKKNPVSKGMLPSGGTAKGGGKGTGNTVGGPTSTGSAVTAVRNRMPKAC